LEEIGFDDVRIGEPVDTFGGATGEANARAFDVNGYAFFARKPSLSPAPVRAESRPLTEPRR
jgi:hypothetical protein